jgi:adenosylmethionine-8-amino-7-oxononanoate aminotransferase
VQAGYAPVPVASAEGCWITTTDRRRIIDLRTARTPTDPWTPRSSTTTRTRSFRVTARGRAQPPAPPPGYLPGLRALCDSWDLLLIVDETMTGMGRTGRMFAFEHYGIEPDIVVLGKALGVQCPMAATVFSARVARSFDHHIFGHGQSFSGHALGAAAALASIDVLHEEGLLERTRELGALLGERLRSLAPGGHPNSPTCGEI